MISNYGDSFEQWRELFRWVLDGDRVSPRGEPICEIENAQFVVPRYPFMDFNDRELKFDYIRREMQWYLRAELGDLSIAQHAKLWEQHINVDGTLTSNYGYYFFKLHGLEKIVNELTLDRDSRRAAVSIFNSHQHLNNMVNDVPCTYGVSFRIRRGKLNMTVRMRSNDLWSGLGNDAPVFHWFHMMALRRLQLPYPTLQLGTYTHSADSLHLYKRNWPAAERIAMAGSLFRWRPPPEIRDGHEVAQLTRGLPCNLEFSQWLREVCL